MSQSLPPRRGARTKHLPYWRSAKALDPRGWLIAVRSWQRLSPPTLFVASFALLIAVGTAGLVLVPHMHAGPRLSVVDALFTITSATCVTGLTVVDTGTQFSFLGQLWILLFIQLGGIGVITLTSILIGALGRQLSLRSEMLLMAPTQHGEKKQVWRLAWKVTRFTFVVELAGAAALFVLWWPDHGAGPAAWQAVFHSISAFCNAGFALFSDNMIGFQKDPATLLVLSLLIVSGGVGYLTFEELLRWRHAVRAQRAGLRLRFSSSRRLSSHTWAVVVTTMSLLAIAFVLGAAFEWSDSLAGLPVFDKLVNAWFMAVTCRTAGFNAIDYAAIGNDTALLTMLMMFIGGSPGSTAGGVKTTTIAVLVALAMARIRGDHFVGMKQRAIPERTVEAAVGIILLSMLVLVGAFFAISTIESAGASAAATRQQFLPIAFETMSAFSTTGLSMNFTTSLSDAARLVVIGLMFIGRVGLLSFFASISLRRRSSPRLKRDAQEDIIVG